MRITDLFVTLTLALFFGSWLVYDLAVVFYLRPRRGVETITHTIRHWARVVPGIVLLAILALGMLFGHLFLA